MNGSLITAKKIKGNGLLGSFSFYMVQLQMKIRTLRMHK